MIKRGLILRNNDPLFWPDSTTDLYMKQERDKNYSDSINILQTEWFQADLDDRFVLGDQELWGYLYPNVTQPNQQWTFNLINGFIQTVTGAQRRNRKSTICVPILNSSQKTSDQITRLLYHIHKDGLYHTYSDIFEHGPLTKGFDLLGLYLDYNNDPVSGDLKGRHVDFRSVLIDPYFREKSLSDCRYIWTRQFFSKEEAKLFYSKFADNIENLPPGQYRDDKFYFMPEVYQLQFPNVLAIDEYWYLSTREADFIVDVETQEVQEFNGNEEDKKNIYRMFGNRFKFIKKHKKTTRRQLLANDRCMIDEPNPLKIDRYPYVGSYGYFNANTPYYAYKHKGIPRDLRSAQYLFTRQKLSDLDIVEAQQQGIKVKEGSLVTPNDGLNRGHGKMLTLKKTAMMDDVQPMPIVPPSPVMLQMEEMLKDTMHRIAGIDPAAMGMDIDDKAGIITMLRQASTSNNLTKFFDNFDQFQREAGDLETEIMLKNYTYGKIRQIIGEEPTPEFRNKAFGQYQCKVVQGVLTETQEQLELAQLLNLREIFGENTPPPVYNRIIDCMYIQNKTELKEDIQQWKQAQDQQAQQMQQLQMQQLQVDNETKLAYAQSQKGLAAERVAKIQLDKALNAERLQRAEEDKTDAILNLVKAAKEIQGMDVQRLQQQVEILKGLEMPEVNAKNPEKDIAI